MPRSRSSGLCRPRPAGWRRLPGWLGAAAFGLGLALSSGATPEALVPREVTVEPAQTSIYIGRVTLSAPAFQREQEHYVSTYTARVFPYFFSNESGRIWIEASADEIARLRRGEAIDFHGRAENHRGQFRRIEGRATPEDALQGKLKVRIFVSRSIQLIFNTSYKFSRDGMAVAASADP